MFSATVLFLTAIVAVSFLALRTVRGGWAGSFIGLATEFAIWMIWQDGNGELFGLGAGAAVAGVAAFGLPTIDRVTAVPLASALAYAMLWVVPSGPDSPVGFLIAAPAAGFAAGSVLALARDGLARFKLSLTKGG